MTSTPTPAADRLHDRVAKAKKRLDLTDLQMAERLGISRDSFLRRRTGRIPFAAAEYPALADLLGVTLDELHRMAS